ncbi:MAG TPA: hypothetical protein VEW48_15180, partial [Thermoanaerobaculia bacterium]|nr:hypothetical protein [Thermoanaerobaculia bacterium]
MSRATVMAAGLLALLLALPVQGQQWVGERLCPPRLPSGAEFGSAVAVGDDGTIAVGDYRHDVVYLHRNTAGPCEWSTIPSPDRGAWFGFALAIDGDRLLVGAPKPGGTGAVYLVNLGTGGVVPVSVPGSRPGDEVGSAVAMDGTTLAIGARGTDERRGRVYFGSIGSFKVVPVEGLAPNAELGQ